MADILHRIGATATPDKVFDALTTLDGLAAWWTTDTHGRRRARTARSSSDSAKLAAST